MKIKFQKLIAPFAALMLVLGVMAGSAVADTTLTATASQGVNVAKTSDALASGQSFILTEVVSNSLGKNTPTIEFALDNSAKFNWAIVDFAGDDFEAVQTTKVTGKALTAAATGRRQTFTVAGVTFTVEVWDTGTTAADNLTLTKPDGATFPYTFTDGAIADDDVIIIHANGSVITAAVGADVTPATVTVTAVEVGTQIDAAFSSYFGVNSVDATNNDADVTFYNATENAGLALKADPSVGATTNGDIVGATAGNRYITINSTGSLVITNLAEEKTLPSLSNAGLTVSSIHVDTSSSTVGTPVELTIGTGTTDVGVTSSNTFTLVTPQAKGATIVGTATTLPIVAKGVVTQINNTIKITESIAASITDVSSATDEIVVTLPEDLVITVAGSTDSGTDSFNTNDGTAVGNVATYDVTGAATTSVGTAIIGANTKFSVLVPLDYASGDVNANVVLKLSDGTTVTVDVPFFNISDKGSINTAVNSSDAAITTFTTLYAGRAAQNTAAFVKIAETVGASLINGANIQVDLPTGVTFGSDYAPGTEIVKDGTGITNDPTFAGKTDGATADESGVSAMLIKLNSTDSGTAAGNLKIQLDDLDLTDTVATGDLNVSLSGNAGLTAGDVKVAEVLTATTTTVASVPSAVKTVEFAVGDIVVQENKAGALVGGSKVMLLRFPSTVTLDTTVTPTVKTKPASAAESTTLVTGSIVDAQTVKLTVVTASTTGSGAYQITLSGLMATAGSSATAGNLAFSIAGDDDGTFDTTKNTSDEGAKPWKQSVTFASVISDTLLTIDTPTVGDTDFTVSVTPAGNNLGQVGDWFVTAGSQFFDGSNWGDTEVAYEAGATLAAKSFTVSTEGLEVGAKIFIGYGVGLVNTFNNMNTNGTFGLAYTVPEPPPVFTVTPTAVNLQPEGTMTVSVTNGTAPYTIALAEGGDAVATVSVESLDADGDFVITAVADGETTVTVTDSADPANTATVTVTVATIPPLAVSSEALTLQVGGDAGTFEITGGLVPYEITNDAEGVATATLDEAGTVTVTPVAAGTATLTVKDSNDPASEKTVVVTVNPEPTALPETIVENTLTSSEDIKDAYVDFGDVATSETGKKMKVSVKFPAFTGAADIYFVFVLPSGQIFGFDADGNVAPWNGTDALTAYAVGATEPITADIVPEFETCNFLGEPTIADSEGTWTVAYLYGPSNDGDFFGLVNAGTYDVTLYNFELSCGE